MKKSRLIGAVCACVVGITISQSISASPITIMGNSVTSRAADTTSDSDQFFGTTIPSSDTLMASFGNSSSTTNISYTGTTSSASFAYDFNHQINTIGDTSYPDNATSFSTYLSFTAINAATCSIDGFYTLTGPAGMSTIYRVWLQDDTIGAKLFQDESWSRNTANESFVLGVSNDGDHLNTTLGSLAGNLTVGHDYRLYFEATISAFNGTDISMVDATAHGAINLSINAVPVPAAIWLFGSGLPGLIGIARRRKAT